MENLKAAFNTGKFESVKTYLSEYGLPTSWEEMPHTSDLTVKPGLTNGRILVDYHPSASSGFHLTAGAYIGESSLLKIGGGYPNEFKGIVDKINELRAKFSTLGIPEIKIDPPTVNGVIVRNSEKTNYRLDADIKINAVKPYLGLGFGRSIPNRRVGVQFELGVMYTGTPKVTSTNSDLEKALNKEKGEDFDFSTYSPFLQFYPVISLKLTGKIF
ncbi:hypothetical protein AGMMS49965_23280 [Bacteroidia bacterium]|nr:hypothetical protein AGMMS49965_23280 [Bacteroidia bacterium]